jgi:DNA-binding beta-propeller fold protein YncE
MRNLLIIFALIAALAAAGWWLNTQQSELPDSSEFTAAASLDLEGSADILRAMPDGTLLVHINAAAQSVGIIDISDYTQPAQLARVSLPGTPTGIDVSPDGRWVLATLNFTPDDTDGGEPQPRLPGGLAIIDADDPGNPLLSEIIGIGHQPVSIAVSSAGADLVAIVAIKNGPEWTENTADSEGTDISQPGQVQVVTFNPLRQKNYRVASPDLSEQRLFEASLELPADAQPEFVALSPDNSQAAVSLTANGGIDVFDPYWLETRRIFSTGDNGSLALSFSPGGSLLFSADGPAGLSVWTKEGDLVWRDMGTETGTDSDSGPRHVVAIETVRFGKRDFALALSNEGLLAVFDIAAPASPSLLQLLPVEPDASSVIALPEQGLLAVSSRSGILQLFRHSGLN